MINLSLELADARAARAPPRTLGQCLVELGHISQADLAHALILQRRMDRLLGEVLLVEGLLTEAQLLAGLARQNGLRVIDIDRKPPEISVARRLPVSVCLRHGVTPWKQADGLLLVATNRPDLFDELRASMGPEGQRMLPVLATQEDIVRTIGRLYGDELAFAAATRVPAAESCRGWAVNHRRRIAWAGGLAALLALCAAAAPGWTLALGILWASLTLALCVALKAAAFVAHLTAPSQAEGRPASSTLGGDGFRLPRVSVLVPLFREENIAAHLVERLTRLTYPKSLLDVVLVLEQDDTVTREALRCTTLPPWMSVLEVPDASRLRTKPRALNYALNFCAGDIIGVWDAEDAPAPDQLERVVQQFHRAAPDVACLQGVLDYYNTGRNLITRCFTLEYATWWRVLLPGLARLGFVLPLGGTTLFFRRHRLEQLGGWDAHNVTEDADLGLRLARHGYRTELMHTATFEEATARPWPWVRQRSRWLKGFLVTWCVHMRRPARLWSELGALRFLGVQTLFLATFSQFLLAPLLWSFWVLPFGIPHPAADVLGQGVMLALIGLFVFAEVLNLGMAAYAALHSGRPGLLAFVPLLPVYFALATAAAFKALAEFVVAPFYWDKTQHGLAPALPSAARHTAPRAVGRPCASVTPPPPATAPPLASTGS